MIILIILLLSVTSNSSCILSNYMCKLNNNNKLNNNKLNSKVIDKVNNIYLPNKYYTNKYTKNLLNKNINNYDLYNGKYIEYINNYTIEHVYPRCILKSDNYACKDMHNLYLTNKYYNNHRSNYKYTSYNLNISDLLVCIDNDYKNYKSDSLRLYIPYLHSRGKIARTIAYMNIIYPDICNKIKIHNFVININLLKYWNYKYPPSTEEEERNLIIYKYQGNYNPFIINNKLINKYF